MLLKLVLTLRLFLALVNKKTTIGLVVKCVSLNQCETFFELTLRCNSATEPGNIVSLRLLSKVIKSTLYVYKN